MSTEPPTIPAPPLPDGVGGASAVTVMWRPGCPFCALLLGRLDRSGLAFERVDIWEVPDAAAWVRTVADGNETVPTVRVAGAGEDSAVALVNPSLAAVLDVVVRLAPDALPAADTSISGRSGPFGLLLARLRGRRGRDRGPAAPR